SLLLAGGGEFVFVIFSPSVAQEFLPKGFVDVLFLVVIFSMALTPLLAVLGKWCMDKLYVYESYTDSSMEAEGVSELKNHVIIAGFGRVGQMLGKILASQMVPFVALDIDLRRVSEGREKGYSAFYGDARHREVLKAVGAEQAKVVVITLDEV